MPTTPQRTSCPMYGPEELAPLLRAMTASVAARGYRETSIADVIARAGMARSTFYTRFPDKERCFLAAYDGILAEAIAQMRGSGKRTGSLHERLESAIGELLGTVAARPEIARVALIESHAAGAAARAQRSQAMETFAGLVRQALGGEAANDSPLARLVPVAICGALEAVLIGRVRDGRHTELPALSGPLTSWVASFAELVGPHPPELPPGPPPKRSRRRGQAPGSLVPTSPSGRRGLPPGPKREPRDFIANNVRDRLLDAVATVTAGRGYDGLTVASVVGQAETSRRSFYEHFSSMPEAFRAALVLGAEGAIAATLLAFGTRADWSQGFVAGLEGFIDFLSEEPAFATLALVEVLSAGNEAIAERDRAMAAFVALVAAVFRVGPQRDGIPPELEAELAVGAVLALCAAEVAAGRTAELPALAPAFGFIALTPPLGAEEALAAVKSARGED